jgi:hypothetical protein
MKLDYRNEVKAIGATALVLVCLVLFAYSMFWVIAYGWAMVDGNVNKWFVYILAIAIVLVIHRFIRKKVYNPDGD